MHVVYGYHEEFLSREFSGEPPRSAMRTRVARSLEVSGPAVGRGLLKLRDFLLGRGPGGRLVAGPPPECGGSLHLLCHSMGNYVLERALAHVAANSVGRRLPRLFDQVLLCAADVDDDVLEQGGAMERLPEVARHVSVYHNDEDRAMWLSENTKGNPDRLGRRGPRRLGSVDDNVHAVDCGPIVTGFVEHSYYLCGRVVADIRECIDGAPPDKHANREAVGHGTSRHWRMS